MNLTRDIRFSLRGLLRSPGFTVVAVLTLAVGIGATAAIFSVFHAVLVRPLPMEEPARTVMLWGRSLEQEIDDSQVSPVDYFDWSERSETLSEVALFRPRSFNLIAGDVPERLTGTFISHEFFSVLGVQPIHGRDFSAADAQPGSEEMVILSHRLWKERFGSDPSVIGRALPIQGSETLTVVGVLPEEVKFTSLVFDFPTDMWVSLKPERTWNRGSRWLWAIGRVESGSSVREAQAELGVISRQLASEYPDTNEGWDVKVEPLHEAITGEVKTSLVMVFAMVAMVLLVACANVANLLLTRAVSRQSEVAVRSALGAGRGRVVRQLLTEGIVLSVFGSAVGLFFAHWMNRALATLGPRDIPRLRRGQSQPYGGAVRFRRRDRRNAPLRLGPGDLCGAQEHLPRTARRHAVQQLALQPALAQQSRGRRDRGGSSAPGRGRLAHPKLLQAAVGRPGVRP